MFKVSKKKKKRLEQHVKYIQRYQDIGSIFNFELILHFILLFILLNSNREMSVGPEVGSATVRNILPYGLGWPGTIYWAICLHLYSPDITLQMDKFSRQHLQKISWTLFLPSAIFKRVNGRKGYPNHDYQNIVQLWKGTIRELN